MQSPFVYVSRSELEEIGEQHYGLGLACYTYRGERAVAHDGGWIGWGTRIDMPPDRKPGVVVLTNRAPSLVTNILNHTVFDRICGKEPVPWFDCFRQRRRDVFAQQDDHRKARTAARKPDTKPSHALAEYAGEYEPPGYGRIAIDTKDGTAELAASRPWRPSGASPL